ncbi:hypothetical protein [Shewanella marina]|uniref:hypothetical protein n=1 Tax=Shewanella marina TaxID=487319 RepID=UPI00046FC46D|nr:hypothetical protein [Shewanella marina]
MFKKSLYFIWACILLAYFSNILTIAYTQQYIGGKGEKIYLDQEPILFWVTATLLVIANGLVLAYILKTIKDYTQAT